VKHNPVRDNIVQLAALIAAPALGYVIRGWAGAFAGFLLFVVLILAVFGLIALGAYLTRGRSGRLGLAAAVVSMFANLAFLSILGASAFAAPATEFG